MAISTKCPSCVQSAGRAQTRTKDQSDKAVWEVLDVMDRAASFLTLRIFRRLPVALSLSIKFVFLSI